MRKIMLFFCLALISTGLAAQKRQWVFFSDKGPEAAELLAQPECLLSPMALAKRAQRGIPVDMRDVPVSQTYIEQLRAQGVEVHAASRWLNAVSITTGPSFAELQCICPSINGYEPVRHYEMAGFADDPLPGSPEHTAQTEMLNANKLIDRGMDGSTVLLTVCDAGFYGVDTMAAFQHLWKNNRILGSYDFVDDDETVYTEHHHGLQVLSTIAAKLEDFQGIATNPQLLLARTEDHRVEVRKEEDNWVMAMEWADSMGTDVIHSSLGYSRFDEGEESYTYDMLDGDTPVLTRAADVAASRGILVTTSAGNEGNGSWNYITVPCDADSVLCVGSVTSSGDRSGFSSVGPTADGRIKPEVVAMGSWAQTVGTNGKLTRASGTSFSGPQIAGLVTLLWQAHPDRSNMEIIDAVIRSGSQYETPDTSLGYGLPDAMAADKILAQMDKDSEKGAKKLIKDMEFKYEADKHTLVMIDPSANLVVTGMWVDDGAGRPSRYLHWEGEYGINVLSLAEDMKPDGLLLKVRMMTGEVLEHQF